MAAILHIVNGDETVARLGPVLPGEILVWRDILVEGPVAPDVDVQALAPRRAPWLARRLQLDADDYLASARTQAEGLARASTHDEIVLWFEHDLFCVVNLCHLAAWLERTRPRARVSLVFPARPLGTTEPEILADLFAARAPFTDAAIARAAVWWKAYAASDPAAIDLAGADALPFLDVAWRLHLERFPWVGSGLGTIEAATLATLDDTARAVTDVFREATRNERMRGHGLGDLQLVAYLRALADGDRPLVSMAGEGGDDVARMTVSITDEGRAVRAGTRDRLAVQSLDWWIGGVHLEGRHAPWRWNPATARLVGGTR